MKHTMFLIVFFLCVLPSASGFTKGIIKNGLTVITPSTNNGLDDYVISEVKRIFLEHLEVKVSTIQHDNFVSQEGENIIIIGTIGNNSILRHLSKNGFINEIKIRQGYSIRCALNPSDKKSWILAILGSDENGTLYGLRDLEHYYLGNFINVNGNLCAKYFEATDYPRIEYRGHWVWGVNMPDKKAWMENMSRWKLNELIEWDNYPPEKSREYVEFAHNRGIRVIWGFGWGWNPDWNYVIPEEFDFGVGEGVIMCGSSEFNRGFFKREILKKVRDIYVPTGCDGIYFQSFTETTKCQCDKCINKTMGQILLEFVNPIIGVIKNEFPDLWISCGVHANFGVYDELKNLDSRCNIYWENCDSGTSIRGENEDFGYINKSIPYSHGYSKTCPADPPYTEESLQAWMHSNQKKYTLTGDIHSYCDYFKKMQIWSRKFLSKESINKHACCVADHSVFCRRTPFMHVALAESQWNPYINTEERVNSIIDFLNIRSQIDEVSDSIQHDRFKLNN